MILLLDTCIFGALTRALLNFTVFELWQCDGKTMLSELIKRWRVMPIHQFNALNHLSPPARGVD